jgi:DNA-binding protein H-NS
MTDKTIKQVAEGTRLFRNIYELRDEAKEERDKVREERRELGDKISLLEAIILTGVDSDDLLRIYIRENSRLRHKLREKKRKRKKKNKGYSFYVLYS